MLEILIISGKGGTGKTTLSAAFAHLAPDPVICDLDVDAPDLHLLLQPEILHEEEFISGNEAVIIPEKCEGCGLCFDMCRFGAVSHAGDRFVIDPLKCEGCSTCVVFCPAAAIDFPAKHCGNWYTSRTRFGPMVHAQLFPGEENSGRLVALLRQRAKAMAEEEGRGLVLSDGPPGIGCPVISSLSGTTLAVIVTEPTPSGLHDLERVVELCGHFRVPAGVIINKWDLNKGHAATIERSCSEKGLPVLGCLPHDPVFTRSMVAGKTLTEYQTDGLADEIRKVWREIEHLARARDAA